MEGVTLDRIGRYLLKRRGEYHGTNQVNQSEIAELYSAIWNKLRLQLIVITDQSINRRTYIAVSNAALVVWIESIDINKNLPANTFSIHTECY